jgi:hypothetical protein
MKDYQQQLRAVLRALSMDRVGTRLRWKRDGPWKRLRVGSSILRLMDGEAAMEVASGSNPDEAGNRQGVGSSAIRSGRCATGVATGFESP